MCSSTATTISSVLDDLNCSRVSLGLSSKDLSVLQAQPEIRHRTRTGRPHVDDTVGVNDLRVGVRLMLEGVVILVITIQLQT
ncbi:hypothetical protein CJ301_05720 [Limimaricola cinnabarinus]|uniref:Uncharacterized protein n=1 Tax=Limimaricola cinnabarinus TaxID=1125964 RepID=A0A2G1MIX4_9RHOB|nr:hypothetical protein CJ301_05720 [Limimaricola cinnabarinus]